MAYRARLPGTTHQTMTESYNADDIMQNQTKGAWTIQWGHLLRMARQVAGLSLNDLAIRSGLSKGYLSKLESAHPSAANPSRATLAALARSLPSTLPLIQQLDPSDELPAPAILLQEQQQGIAINTLQNRQGVQILPSPGFQVKALDHVPQPLPADWTDWEIILAVRILENSGLGPPTLPMLARACGMETLSSESLERLEQAELLRRIPPTRPGEAIRYTQGSTQLEQFSISQLAEFFLQTACNLLLKTGNSEHEPTPPSHTRTSPH